MVTVDETSITFIEWCFSAGKTSQNLFVSSKLDTCKEFGLEINERKLSTCVQEMKSRLNLDNAYYLSVRILYLPVSNLKT
jgi:hypothetical protein